MEKIDLIEILEKEVYPRLSASQIYTWEGHNFKESADRWRGNPPWGKSKSGSSFAVFPLSLRFIDSHNSEAGDPVKYLYSLKIGQYEYPKGRDWIETIKELFAIAGVSFPDREWTPQQIKAAQQRQTRQEILKLVQGYCQEYLWTDNGYPERHHLINERGFTEESLKSLGIGLYPSSTDEMEEFLRTNQIDLRLANQIGVLASAWCGYIVFPWSSAYGDPLTLYGHQSKEWAIATDKPKKYALFNPKENKQAWLHTKESPYLFDRALKNHHRELVLVEGITDAAIAHQYEDTRVVACVAAMLSKDQCETLKRHRIERVIIALDPDEAGDKGIESCIKNLIQIGITPFVAPRLPDTLDPDEFIIKYGIDTWKEHIAGAHHGFTWKAKQIVKNSNLSTDYGKEKAIKLAKKFADSQNDKLAIANFFIPNLPFSLEPKTAQNIEEEENDSGELNKITRTENLIRSRWGNGKLRLNLMTKQLELDGKRFKLSRAVTTIAREFNIKIAADLAVEICVAIAEDNAYSPVRAYLENLKQQNITPYNLDTLAQDYLGCPDSLGYLKKTLIGAVARAMDPGCKMDTMLILQGKQGTYKSTFWSILAGKNGDQPFFTDNISDQDKDERMKLTRYWILEYSEFEAVYKRKDVETLKNFLTTKYDSIRLPYGREVEDFYRSSIFVGTTNRTDILKDPTGARRFWILPVGKKIPISRLESDRDRIWLAALQAYERGDKWYLNEIEALVSEEENRNWGVSDTWEETILNRIDAIIDTSGFLTISSIMTHILGLELKAQSRAEQMRIADILRSNGFTQARVGGVRGWKREVVNEVVNSEFSTVQGFNQPTNLANLSEDLVEIVPTPSSQPPVQLVREKDDKVVKNDKNKACSPSGKGLGSTDLTVNLADKLEVGDRVIWSQAPGYIENYNPLEIFEVSSAGVHLEMVRPDRWIPFSELKPSPSYIKEEMMNALDKNALTSLKIKWGEELCREIWQNMNNTEKSVIRRKP